MSTNSHSSDHASDVLAGSLLGLVVAYFSYRQYYPSLAAKLSHRPYPPRIKREDVLPSHNAPFMIAEAEESYMDEVGGDSQEFSREPVPQDDREDVAV